MDLGFNLAQSNRDLKDPTSRQNFGDTSGLLCKNDLIPCRKGKIGSGKHKMLSKLATQSFNILWLIARNPNFLQPKVPYFNVSRRFATFPDQ